MTVAKSQKIKNLNYLPCRSDKDTDSDLFPPSEEARGESVSPEKRRKNTSSAAITSKTNCKANPYPAMAPVLLVLWPMVAGST